MNSQAIIVLGRYPKLGQVKTRLAKEIGEHSALEFYTNTIEKIFQELELLKTQSDIYFYHANASDHELVKKWVGHKFFCVSPKSSDITTHLKDAFTELFAKGYSGVICLSTDVPQLNAILIREAFLKLEDYDGVLGPDNDGGIYLYGAKKHQPDLFNQVLSKKPAQLVKDYYIKHNLKLFLLPQLIDVDTKSDLTKLQNAPSC